MLDSADNSWPQDRDLTAVFVHDQIDIASSEAFFDILQTMELFRQWAQGLGQMLQLFRLDRQFAGIGLADITLDADDVAQIRGFKQFVDFFPDNAPC